jgi:hypothetical protein
VADVPDYIVLRRHRDLDGLRKHSWPRHAILAAVAALSILGLLDVFGQRPSTSTASAPAAKLELYVPSSLRGGLLFSARFRIAATRDLKDATLVLDSGWLEGMAVNTIEPSPVNEGSTDGRLTLELGHIPAGRSYVLWMQFQANPTNVAWRRPAGVTLLDGSRPLLHIDRSVTVFP